LSRLRLFAILASLLAFATCLAACGGSSEDPNEMIENATLEGVKSGVLDLSLDVTSRGEEGGEFKLSLSGPFQGESTGQLPQLDLDAKAKGHGSGETIDFEGGLTVLSDRAFVAYEGTEYEVDPTTFGFVTSALEQAQQKSKDNAANPTACQDAASGLKVDEFVTGLKNEGEVDVDGTQTTKLSGELNVGKAIDAAIALAEDPACSAQLEAAGPLPLGELEKAKREISSSLKKTHVELYMGDDHIIRKLAADFTVTPKGHKGSVEVDLELSLAGVNETQQIAAPSSAKPLEVLFRKLHINSLELLEKATSGEGLGEILEELSEGQSEGGGSSQEGGGSSEEESGGAGGAGGPGGESQTAYLECLQKARTPVDLQNCASLLG
jgi:hypothetical protein